MPEKIRVLIFEDHAQMRNMYELMLDSEPDMLCVGAQENCNNAIKIIEKTLPDVILMDIQMPGKSGVEAAREIKNIFPTINIIMQTIFSDDDKIFESICNGASGYLLKNSTLEEFLSAIRQVHVGGAPMSPSVALKVLNRFRQSNTAVLPPENFNLTDREKEILGLLANGQSYKLIASQLNISYYTVDSHIRKIYEKLHVRSATEAIKKAIDNRLV
ncbi:MAG TPA: response regulator transcription factor [Bacteroidia bacterium]|nr:response regulator transcription factor [Bacteroidia bacterium]